MTKEKQMKAENTTNLVSAVGPVISVASLDGNSVQIEFLIKKLSDYKSRHKRLRLNNKHMHPNHLYFADTKYKIAVLALLLKMKSVNTFELSLRIAKVMQIKNQTFHESAFSNACGVIQDYILNDGANTYKE